MAENIIVLIAAIMIVAIMEMHLHQSGSTTLVPIRSFMGGYQQGSKYNKSDTYGCMLKLHFVLYSNLCSSLKQPQKRDNTFRFQVNDP